MSSDEQNDVCVKSILATPKTTCAFISFPSKCFASISRFGNFTNQFCYSSPKLQTSIQHYPQQRAYISQPWSMRLSYFVRRRSLKDLDQKVFWYSLIYFHPMKTTDPFLALIKCVPNPPIDWFIVYLIKHYSKLLLPSLFTPKIFRSIFLPKTSKAHSSCLPNIKASRPQMTSRYASYAFPNFWCCIIQPAQFRPTIVNLIIIKSYFFVLIL